MSFLSDPLPAPRNLERSYKELEQLLKEKRTALEKMMCKNEDLKKLLDVQVKVRCNDQVGVGHLISSRLSFS